MRWTAFFLLFVLVSSPAGGVLTFYTDEAAYLAELSSLGYYVVIEGFEDDLVWGTVRTNINDRNYASVIISQGITWTSNHPENEITTSSGAALTGLWGFYSIPHGNYATGTDCHLPGNCGDGFIGTRADTIFAVGGWITGTFGGRLNVILDGDTLNAVDFDGLNHLESGHQFFGVIETNGFFTFEFREMEGVAEDGKYIWADDFSIGLPSYADVMITSFDASVSGIKVELSWQISTDETIAGYRIVREEMAEGSVLSLPAEGLLDPYATSFVDTDVYPGREYAYTLTVVKSNGEFVQSVQALIRIEFVPAKLYQNFPNPFNPVTTIRYFVDRESDVSLRIYDASGAYVRTLIDKRMDPGEYFESWDGMDGSGDPAVSGVYFYRLRVGKNILTRKMVLVK